MIHMLVNTQHHLFTSVAIQISLIYSIYQVKSNLILQEHAMSFVQKPPFTILNPIKMIIRRGIIFLIDCHS